MLNNEIANQLNSLGVSHKIKGYKYCFMAVEVLTKNNGFMKIEDIYETVSKKFSTNKECVERNIRYAIEKTWEKGNIMQIDKVFGLTVNEQKGKPTNMEFIYMIADRIKNTSA